MDNLSIKNTNNVYLGLLLFSLGLVNTLAQLFVSGSGEAPLWICNFSSIIAGIAIWKKNIALTASVFFTALVYQSPILIDFITYVLGYAGNTSLVDFMSLPFFAILFSIMSHAFLLPLSLYFIWGKVISYSSIIYGYVLFGLIMFPLSRIFGDRIQNINCSYMPCGELYVSSTDSTIHFISMVSEYFIILPIMIFIWNLLWIKIAK